MNQTITGKRAADVVFFAPLEALGPNEYEAHVIYAPMEGTYPGHFWATCVRPLDQWGGCIGRRGLTPAHALREIERKLYDYRMATVPPAQCRRATYYLDLEDGNDLVGRSIHHAEGKGAA